MMSIIKVLWPGVAARDSSTPERSNSVFRGALVLGFFGIGFLFLYAYGIRVSNNVSGGPVFSFLSLIAFGSFAVVGMIGFLFGISHKLQTAQIDPATVSGGMASPGNYSENTNLEQISDWLTKILVGVGLTQIHEILSRFNQLCIELGKATTALVEAGGAAPGRVATIYSIGLLL